MANYMVTSQSDLFRLFDTVGIPKRTAGSLILHYLELLVCNGPEWTVARLTELHVLAVQWVGRNFGYRIPQQAKIQCHADGVPKGPFAWFFRRILKIGSPASRELDVVFVGLKLYTDIELHGTITSAQWKKFLAKVETPKPDRSGWEWPDLSDYSSVLRRLWREASYESLERWTDTPRAKVTRFIPTQDRFDSVREISLSIDQHRWDAVIMCPITITRFSRLYTKALGRHALPADARNTLADSLNQLELPGYGRWKTNYLAMEPCVGSIGVIQERGAKARTVANPLRVHQVATSRLKNFLELCVIRGLPWDCTFDQGKGVRWLQSKLKAGKTLRTTDLSGATDRFPSSVIYSLLKIIGPSSWEFQEAVELQEHLSRQKWYVPFRYSPPSTYASVKWTKGTPLGIYSCFLSFAVTHGFLLRSLELRNGLEDCFRVLGDDVIMTTELATHYEFWLERMGAPTNGLKGLTSQYVGEFASKLACKSRIIKTSKYPSGERLFSTRRPLDLLVKFGPKAIRLVPARFRQMVLFLSSLPKEKGGLGWKPPKEEDFCDSRKLLSIVAPESAKQISDVLYTERINGGKSLVIRQQRRASRLFDLEVAFCHSMRPMASGVIHLEPQHPISKAILKWWLKHDPHNVTWTWSNEVTALCCRAEGKVPGNVDSKNPKKDPKLPSEDLQWEILQANSNLDDFSASAAEYRDRIRKIAAAYPPKADRIGYLEEQEDVKFTQKTTILRERLTKAITGYLSIPLLAAWTRVKKLKKVVLIYLKPR